MYTESSIVARVEVALRRLAQQDKYLLGLEGSECAIAHRLAVYLEDLFPKWHIDCEFSRDGIAAKQITLETDPQLVRPDIIVHRRGPRGPNLLAIEVKRLDDECGRAYDLAKLAQYRAEKNYKMALFLYLPIGAFSPVLCWI